MVGVVGIVPNLPQRILGKRSCSLDEAAVILAMMEKVDEILDLGDLLLGQRADLLEKLLVPERIAHASMLHQWAAAIQA